MNKWQIICPVVALLLAATVFAVISGRSHRRAFVSAASQAVGRDLIASTNSARLVGINSDLQARLSSLLGSPTHVASVLFGDEPAPLGDGRACSRLVLTNNSGDGLLIRLRQADSPDIFQVLGFRSVSQ